MAGLSLRGHGKDPVRLLCCSPDLGSKRCPAGTAVHVKTDPLSGAADPGRALPVRPVDLECKPGLHLSASCFPHPLRVALGRSLDLRHHVVGIHTHPPGQTGLKEP